MQAVTQIYQAARYVGDEASANDVFDTVKSTVFGTGSVWTLASFNADGMTLHEVNLGYYGDAGSDWFLKAGSWFVVSNLGIIDILPDDAFTAKWHSS